MNKICNHDECTGCGLCLSRCPKHSISMRQDSFGHLYPVINNTTCVDCGLCVKSCPAVNTPIKKIATKAYALFAIDEKDYKSSTSGAAASLLSQAILNHQGVVYGCATEATEDGNINVKHIRVDNSTSLLRLKGSKYVQSNITEIIPLLVNDVRNGMPVLFIGTPCQVAAIKNLYKEQPQNLYTVDLICHGVPSLSLLQKHISHVTKGKPVDEVKFRDGNGMYLLLLLRGEIVYRMPLFKERYKDEYMNAFFDGYTYRESCYKCKYACPQRVSDITIGDFWGLGKESDDSMIPEHKNGISVALPITNKGQELIDKISELSHIYERPISEAIHGNSQLMSPKRPDAYAKLFRFLNSILGFYKSYHIAVLPIKMRKRLANFKNR